mgnify:CR=1 FL=1
MKTKLRYLITSYTLHGVLIVMCVYAIGCCGFHVLPVLGELENYESINNTFLSFALSYIAGLIIFLLTSVMPRIQREKEIFAQWEPHLSKLYNDMSERIEEVRAFVGIDKDKMGALTVEDCKPLERYTDLPPVVRVSRAILTKGSDTPNRINDDYSMKKRLKGHHKSVHHLMDVMLNNPVAVNAEASVLDILSQIRSSSFLGYCDSIMDSSQLQNPPISICHSELPEPFCEYVKLRDRLGTLPIKKKVYEIRVLTEAEVRENQKRVKEELERQGYTMEQIKAFGKQIGNASK